MRSTNHRKHRVLMSFVVQVSGILPSHALERERGVHRYTVLDAHVADQAAMYGLVKALNDLGLDLLDLRQLTVAAEAGDASSAQRAAPLTIEVVIRGSLGDLAMSALCDHVEVTHLATRMVLPDHQATGQVLEWARAAGAAVEYAADAPQ